MTVYRDPMACHLPIVVLLLLQTAASLDAGIAEAERRNLARAAAVNDEEAARLTLEWLLALNRLIGSAFSDPNLATSRHPWFRKQTETLFYNEIGGNWLINDQLVWNLHAKYRQTAAADVWRGWPQRFPRVGSVRAMSRATSQ